MKREEALKSVQQNDVKFDINEIVGNDRDYIDDRISENTRKLRDANKGINAVIKNPELQMDAAFISLVTEKEKLTKHISLLKDIQNEYL